MKIRALIIIILFLAGMEGSAQTNSIDSPSVSALSGVWTLNLKDSSGPRVEKGLLWTISVTQAGVSIERSHVRSGQIVSYKVILFSDGRGETNLEPVAGMPEGHRFMSKTVWKKDRLTRRIPAGQVASYLGAVTEVYKLAKSGTQLIVERDESPGALSLPGEKYVVNRLVFDKKVD